MATSTQGHIHGGPMVSKSNHVSSSGGAPEFTFACSLVVILPEVIQRFIYMLTCACSSKLLCLYSLIYFPCISTISGLLTSWVDFGSSSKASEGPGAWRSGSQVAAAPAGVLGIPVCTLHLALCTPLCTLHLAPCRVCRVQGAHHTALYCA